MDTVILNPHVEVNIYKVNDQNGNEYQFSIDTDNGGDIIITLTEDDYYLEAVKDYAMDNMNKLIKDSCVGGLRLCLETIKEQHPELLGE